MGIGGSYNTQTGYGANLSWGAEQNANRFGSVSGSLNWQNGGGMSVSSSYTLDNKEAAAEFLKKKTEAIEKGRKAGIEGTDDQVLAELSNRAKKAGEDNNSLTNDISKLLIGEFGGGLSTLFGRGSDATGYINDKGEYVVRTCFVAGTLVTIVKREYRDKILSSNGITLPNARYEEKVAIQTVKVGDVVLSWNEGTKKNEYKRVLNTFVRETKTIFTLTYEDGTQLQTTWNHPFYIKDKGFVEAKSLVVGDLSATANGDNLKLVGIGTEDRIETVYNFEVEDDHTYFVGDDEVLVHNQSSMGIMYSMDLVRSKRLSNCNGDKKCEKDNLDAYKKELEVGLAVSSTIVGTAVIGVAGAICASNLPCATTVVGLYQKSPHLVRLLGEIIAGDAMPNGFGNNATLVAKELELLAKEGKGVIEVIRHFPPDKKRNLWQLFSEANLTEFTSSQQGSINKFRGEIFQMMVNMKRGMDPYNAGKISIKDTFGKVYNFIPDNVLKEGLHDSKDVLKLGITNQIEGMLLETQRLGKVLEITVSKRTEVTKDLFNRIKDSGGKITVYDPINDILYPYVQKW